MTDGEKIQLDQDILGDVAVDVLSDHLCSMYGQKYWIVKHHDFNSKSVTTEYVSYESGFNHLVARYLSGRLKEMGVQHNPFMFKGNQLSDILDFVAMENTRDPLKETLEKLHEDWVAAGSPDYLTDFDPKAMLGWSAPNLTEEEESVYLRNAFMITLFTLAQRGLGNKVIADVVLIISGGQGVGKSSFCRAMGNLGGESTEGELPYFHSIGGIYSLKGENTVRDKIATVSLGKSTVELSEIDSLLDSEFNNSSLKSFFSLPSVTFRPAFGRAPVTVPLSGCFIGTTNRPRMFSDGSGNRRYAVVYQSRVENPIYLEEGNKTIRGMIGQAVDLVQKGFTWRSFCDSKMEELIQKTSDAALVVEDNYNAFFETIADYCNHPNNPRGSIRVSAAYRLFHRHHPEFTKTLDTKTLELLAPKFGFEIKDRFRVDNFYLYEDEKILADPDLPEDARGLQRKCFHLIGRDLPRGRKPTLTDDE